MAARATTVSKAAPKTRSAAKASTRVTKKKVAAKSEEAPATTATATRTRKKAKTESRTRIYWAVFNQNLKRVALFEFDQKGEAEKRASKLSDKSGEYHFIQKQKVAVTE